MLSPKQIFVKLFLRIDEGIPMVEFCQVVVLCINSFEMGLDKFKQNMEG